MRVWCLRVAAAAICGSLLATALSQPLEAQTGTGCTITTSGVSFGNYDVFSGTALDAAGAVTYQCPVGQFIQIQLQTGSSGSFDPRTLQLGAERLNYNLFLEDSRITIWGNGSAGTSIHATVVTTSFPVNVPVYGRIPARQDVAQGAYSDSVVATIIF